METCEAAPSTCCVASPRTAQIAAHRQFIHKIGVTGGKVETRIVNVENNSTYMLAKVEVVATYKLAGIGCTKLEGLFHKIFASAQLDLTILDRFGNPPLRAVIGLKGARPPTSALGPLLK
jgi:hypothetical protein